MCPRTKVRLKLGRGWRQASRVNELPPDYPTWPASDASYYACLFDLTSPRPPPPLSASPSSFITLLRNIQAPGVDVLESPHRGRLRVDSDTTQTPLLCLSSDMASPTSHTGPVGPDTLITVKVICDGQNRRFKLALRDLGAHVLPQTVSCVAAYQPCLCSLCPLASTSSLHIADQS